MLGIIWSHLWKQDPKTYIPFVSSGMIAWAMLSTITAEGTSVFVAAQTLIRELPTSYTMLAWALVWRNLIAFGHNFIIYVGVLCIALSSSAPTRSRDGRTISCHRGRQP
jgi:ABC-type polysaccharide/polyol phosphate export permease